MAPEEDGRRPAVGVAELIAACAAAEAVSTPPAPGAGAVPAPSAPGPEADGPERRPAGETAAAPEQHAA